MEVRENVTLYICDHCGKRLIRKSAMIKHEDNCSQNPKNIPACYSCKFLEQEEIEYYTYGYNDTENSHKSTCLRCTKKNVLMYPPKAKRLALEYPEQFEEQTETPKVCELKKFYGINDSTLFKL